MTGKRFGRYNPLPSEASEPKPAPIKHWHGVAQDNRGEPWFATCSCGWTSQRFREWPDANTAGAVHVWNARQGVS